MGKLIFRRLRGDLASCHLSPCLSTLISQNYLRVFSLLRERLVDQSLGNLIGKVNIVHTRQFIWVFHVAALLVKLGKFLLLKIILLTLELGKLLVTFIRLILNDMVLWL